jgi:hypothetical protein
MASVPVGDLLDPYSGLSRYGATWITRITPGEWQGSEDRHGERTLLM